MNWTAPIKPAEFAENQVIDAILEGLFPIGANLPAERDLAIQLGVTRPTLREALQRLARDGWIEIRHGKPTRVRDYWHEGNLGVLGAIARHTQKLPADFVANLLAVRLLMAPEYTRLAIENQPEQVAEFTRQGLDLPESLQAFAHFDWQLHHQLTTISGNAIFTLILNGFSELYIPMACRYFEAQTARASSRSFYAALHQVAMKKDALAAETITRQVMQVSLLLWQQTHSVGGAS
jgi:GntR family negative regulator for fad regulon and positive regulator of fabA